MSANNAKRGQIFDSEDISLFCAQLSLILKSGISIYDGMCAINENIKNSRAHKVLKQIEADLEVNSPFYKSLRNSGAFPEYMVNMIEIGEKSGNLDRVIESLSTYYSRDDQLKKNIKNAVMYPSILVLMMFAVIAVLVIKVLPVFSQVFENLGGDMSETSTFIMNLGFNITKYVFAIMLVLIVIAIVIFIYVKLTNSKMVSKFFNNFFVTKKLMNRIASARFASVMAMMLSSGYGTDEALEMSSNIISSKTIVDRIAVCRKEIAEGVSFPEAIEKASLFQGIYQQMISIGVKTGSLDNVMKKLADVYNDEVDRSITRTISLIEPCLVGFLSIIIGAILISVMLPLMGIMSSIG